MSVIEKGKSLVRFFKRKEQVPIMNIVTSSDLLNNRVALITGGSSGIGFAIAQKFVESGCKVIIAGRDENKLQVCSERLGVESKYIVLVVSDFNDIRKKIPIAEEMFSDKINILVNCAGIGVKNSFWNINEDEYCKIMDTNVKGLFFVSQMVSKYMVDNHICGHILNISSSSGMRPAWTPYEMSKWAVNGFTKGLADTLIPYGIVVNAIAPGPTITPLIGKSEKDNLYSERSLAKRFIMPEEIANIAVLLTSDAGNMIVGDTVYCSGGSGVITYHN